MDSFVARPSIPRLLLLLAGAIGFVALGAWIAGLIGDAPEPGKTWIGWLSIAFFGPCAAYIFKRLFDRDDQLIISRSGIMSKPWSDDTIPWSAITQVGSYKIEGQSFIVLCLADPERYPSKRLLGKVAAANRAMTGGDITISLSGTDGRFDDAMAAIQHFWSSADR